MKASKIEPQKLRLKPSRGKIFTLKKLFEPGSPQTSALLEVANTANFNISCVPGLNPPNCADQSEMETEASFRQDRQWAPIMDAHWWKEPGKGPSGPIGMQKTEEPKFESGTSQRKPCCSLHLRRLEE